MSAANNDCESDSKADRALLDAADQGDAIRVRQLLDAGANVAGASVLASAARSRFSNAQTVGILLEYGANVLPSEGQRDPLLLACHQSDDERIQLIIEHGADVNAEDHTPRGCTPLQELVRCQL